MQAGVGWAKSVISTAMRSKLSFVLVVLLFFAEVGLAAGGAAPANIQIYFSPKGGCTEAVVDALSKAKSTVLVQAYSFTSAPIAKALTDAHRRGVKIQVILDKSNQTDKYSAATFTQTLRTASLTNPSNQRKRDADSARVWFI